MWEKLLEALVGLIEKTTVYLEVSTELRRRELEEPPEPRKITINRAEPKATPIPTEDEAESGADNKAAASVPEPPKPVVETPVEEQWLSAEETAKLLDITTTHLAACARNGFIPSRLKAGCVNRREYLKKQIVGKTLDDLRWKCAVERGSSDKERRWKLTELASSANCCKTYSHGTPRKTVFSRIYAAKRDGILNTYNLMGVEYINLDELKRYTEWWDRNFHQLEKNACADFHQPADAYCVHENDLIWTLTRDYNTQLHPTEAQITEFRTVARTLPSLQVKGVRFYRADAIKKIETMRELLSHVERVER